MSKIDGFVQNFFQIGTWLARLMFLNALWFLFTFLGLGIFGIFPATASLVYIMYKWFDEDTEIPIFKTFYSYYKSLFVQSNLLGLMLVLIGIFLYFDLRISQVFIGSYFLHYLLLLVTFLFFVTSLYLLTVFPRYELSFFQYFKQAFLVAFSRPAESFAMVISLAVIYFLFTLVPGLIIYIGVSLTFLPVVWFSYMGCRKVEKKRLELRSNK